jgi:hypothetical protein
MTAPTARQPLPPQRAASSTAKLVIPCVIGGLVALTLGLYGRLHSPTGIAVNIAGFSSPGYVKSWLVTAPSWIGGLHRWSGRIAFLAAVPVAIHCLYALGFQNYSTRVLLHSIFGCLFFGAFTVKMLILPKKGLPGWVLPFWGAVVFTTLVLIWLTSAYWFFSTFGVHR